MNFVAANFPHAVLKSMGIDIDNSVLERVRDRMKRRFVPARSNEVDFLL